MTEPQLKVRHTTALSCTSCLTELLHYPQIQRRHGTAEALRAGDKCFRYIVCNDAKAASKKKKKERETSCVGENEKPQRAMML